MLTFLSLQAPRLRSRRGVVVDDAPAGGGAGEGERAHLRARVVARLVAFEDRPPAARDRVAGDELGRVLLRVALHVALYVAAVPGRRLRLDDGAHRRHVPVLLRRRGRAAALVTEDDRRDCEQRGEGEEMFLAHVSQAPLLRRQVREDTRNRAATSSPKRVLRKVVVALPR